MRSHAWLVSVKLLNFSYRPPAGLPERVLWSRLPSLVYGNQLFLSGCKTAQLGYYKCRETEKKEEKRAECVCLRRYRKNCRAVYSSKPVYIVNSSTLVASLYSFTYSVFANVLTDDALCINLDRILSLYLSVDSIIS